MGNSGIESSVQLSANRSGFEVNNVITEERLTFDVDYQSRYSFAAHDLLWGFSHRSSSDDITVPGTAYDYLTVQPTAYTQRNSGIFHRIVQHSNEISVSQVVQHHDQAAEHRRHRQACDRAVAAPVVASVAQSGVQWLQRRWADDALRGQDLARLQPRLAAPVAVQQRALAAPLRDRIDPAAALLPALGPRAAALVWLVLSVPLAELPEPVPVLPPDLSPEMPPEPPPEPQPEPQPDPVPPWAARLLLAEALDLLRDGGAQGWLRAELDDFGLELALHPLGADWPAVLARLQDDADERRRLLDDALQVRGTWIAGQYEAA